MTLTATAITAALIITLCYTGMCTWMPFAHCWRCSGKPGKACPPCDSSGRRVRIGRRLHDWIKHEHAIGRTRDYHHSDAADN